MENCLCVCAYLCYDETPHSSFSLSVSLSWNLLAMKEEEEEEVENNIFSLIKVAYFSPTVKNNPGLIILPNFCQIASERRLNERLLATATFRHVTLNILPNSNTVKDDASIYKEHFADTLIQASKLTKTTTSEQTTTIGKSDVWPNMRK